MGLLYLMLLTFVYVLVVIGWWKMFEKANEEGWKSIIPLLNSYVFFKIAGKNGWGFLLLFIPLVGIIAWLMVSLEIAKNFGKSGVYGFFCVFLIPMIGAIDLGFGESKYAISENTN